MAVDATYPPSVVQHRQDGNMYVPSGKKIEIESGGELSLLSGALSVLPIEATTSSLIMTAADLGKIWTTRGAGGAITFTLPAVSGLAGRWAIFWNVANQNMIVAGPDEGLVVKNDLTADSIAYQTGGELIGSAFLAVCDGTSWLVVPLAEEAVTVTIASA